MTRTAWACLALSVALLAGCTTTPGRPVAPARTTSSLAGLAHRPTALPSGFTAPGGTALAPAPGELDVQPVGTLQPSALHRAPFPQGAALRGALAAVINQPVAVDARPLLASTTTWQPGAAITIVAATRTGQRHDVLFILQGPTQREERLVACRDGLAAGIVVLPATLQRGTWYIAVQDLSALRPGPTGRPVGTALVGLGEVTIA